MTDPKGTMYLHRLNILMTPDEHEAIRLHARATLTLKELSRIMEQVGKAGFRAAEIAEFFGFKLRELCLPEDEDVD